MRINIAINEFTQVEFKILVEKLLNKMENFVQKYFLSSCMFRIAEFSVELIFTGFIWL
jgi:hypothetical protein